MKKILFYIIIIFFTFCSSAWSISCRYAYDIACEGEWVADNFMYYMMEEMDERRNEILRKFDLCSNLDISKDKFKIYQKDFANQHFKIQESLISARRIRADMTHIASEFPSTLCGEDIIKNIKNQECNNLRERYYKKSDDLRDIRTEIEDILWKIQVITAKCKEER